MADAEDEKEEKPQKGKEENDEKFLRLAAEFDNYKKRTGREMAESKNLGKAELLRELLPVLDEFEIALPAAANSTDTHIAKGIELLYSNLKDRLQKEGLQEIPAKGKFDPHVHEIVMVNDETGKPEGTIIEVARKGYTFNGMMLRPAMVIVAKERSDSRKETEKQEQDDTSKK